MHKRLRFMAQQGTKPSAWEASSPKGESACGVPENYERFVEEHYQAAYRFAFSLSGNHNDACDLTQQAFYLAHVQSHQLRDPAKRKQWLFAILHREFLHLYRRNTTHSQISLEFSEPALAPISVDHASRLDYKAVLVVLETLDENFKLPLVLFYLNHLSYREIAAALEVPIGTVMSRLARGKQMLRQRLEEGVNRAGKIVPIAQANLDRRIGG